MEIRRGRDAILRLDDVDEDLDQNEREHEDIRREFRRELASIKKLMIGIFVTTTTGAVGVYLNLIAGTLPGG